MKDFHIPPCRAIRVATTLMLGLAGVLAHAADATLPRIDVVDARESSTQPSIDARREDLKAIPGGASLVDLNQVREGRQSTWSDSLGLAPGVFVQDRFGSEEARISVRGSALSRTYHSFGLKVMQDGVPINYGDGFFDMQTLDPNASRYVEVLRGPNATTYGATTLGGAINFVAPTGLSQPGRQLRAEAGSFGYGKLFGSVAGASPDTGWDHYVAASQTRQDGFRDHAQMENQKLLGNAGLRISRDLETRFYATAVRSRTQLPGYLTLGELQANPRQAQSTSVSGIYPFREDANRRRDVDTQRLANKTTLRDGIDTWEFAAYAMNYSLWHPIDAIVAQNAKTQGGHVKLTRALGAHRWSWAWLPSWGATVGTSSPTNNQGAATDAPTSAYRQQSANQSLFVEDRWQFAPATAATFALQYDRARRVVHDTVLASNNLDATYSQWSPRVGVTHDAAPGVQWFGSLSRNFEAPIFGLAGTSTTVNQAQNGTTLEFGTRGELTSGRHHIGWDATAYRAELHNEFQTTCSNPPGCSSAATQNIPRTRHQGLELGGSHLYAGHLETRAALLYSDFRFVDHPVYGNNKMPGFHPVLLRGESLWRFGADVAGKPASYAGPKFEWAPVAAAMDNTNSLYNGGYAIWGLKAGQAIDRQWSWFVDARNLSNRKYAATTNISANYAGGSAGLQAYYPSDGRALYVGLTAQID